MISQEVYRQTSQSGVSLTIPELDRDIDAQLKALMDEDHPKTAVFLPRGTGLGNRKLPKWVFVERRLEGTLVTTCANAAIAFRTNESLTDADLAAFLGYPESKAEVLKTGDGVVVQAVDKDGCVIFESVASRRRVQESIDAARRQLTAGGYVQVTSPEAALMRRIAGKMN